jgi:hypothetical protein
MKNLRIICGIVNCLSVIGFGFTVFANVKYFDVIMMFFYGLTLSVLIEKDGDAQK